jgi:predicted deacylase
MPTFEFVPLPTQTPGTVRHLHVCRYGKAGARPKIYVQAGIHADELPANLVAHRLALTLGQMEAEGRITGEIVVVPVANPIGLSQVMLNDLQGRYHAGHGGNFNRGWPDVSQAVAAAAKPKLGGDRAENTALVRALVRQALDGQTPRSDYDVMRHALMTFACDADIMLDLHTDADAALHLYIDPGDWPGAGDLAGLLDAAAVIFARDSGDRPFDEASRRPYLEAAAGGAPVDVPMTVTVELRGEEDTDERLTRRDADALVAFLTARGAISGEAPPPRPFRGVAGPYEATDVIKAPAAGILVFNAKPGDRVAAGDVVAQIIDPYALRGAIATPVRTTQSGVLFARALGKLAWPGRQIAKVHGEAPLPHRTGTLLYD